MSPAGIVFSNTIGHNSTFARGDAKRAKWRQHVQLVVSRMNTGCRRYPLEIPRRLPSSGANWTAAVIIAFISRCSSSARSLWVSVRRQDLAFRHAFLNHPSSPKSFRFYFSETILFNRLQLQAVKRYRFRKNASSTKPTSLTCSEAYAPL